MAKLDEYWDQIQNSDSFQNLDTAQKEKVRNSLWDKYVQKSPSYTNLPLSQRNQVRSHFDELTHMKQTSMMDDLEKKGKKIVGEVKPMAEKVGQAVSGAVDVSKVGSDIEDMASTSVEIPGMKKVAGAVSGAAEKAGSAIEPNFVKPQLTNFDVARAIGAGAVRTMGDVLAGIVPTTTMQAAAYFSDPVLKYAGTTFLGRDIHLPGWKPDTGMETADVSVGSQFEKIITQRRIENNARQAT
ncbi:MAG TPA: hypothetical protein VNV63_07790, partial [Nitrospiria bacterium]|nr:hypothetical protein [Nitrospiria bacterium]